MSLHRVVDELVDRLTGALGAGLRVSDVAPAAPADLPCAVLTIAEVGMVTSSIGRIPCGTRTGALPRALTLDLADPVVDLGGGEQLTLLSADRRTLTLPHGALVAADGTDTGPLGPGDVSADDGAAFAVVTSAPGGRQVQADAVAGTLLFGVALATTGTLRVTYHLGQWDVATIRLQGLLSIDVSAADPADVAAASRRVSAVLTAGLTDLTGDLRLQPRSWDAVRPAQLGDTGIRSQRLSFALDAELQEPVLTTGGRVIASVDVHRRPEVPDPDPRRTDQSFEPFEVKQGASP